jgi:hypothetical protein
MKYLLLTALSFALLAGCSRGHGDGLTTSPAAQAPALPASWVSGAGESNELPSPEVARSVEAAFGAHTAALEAAITAPAPAAETASKTTRPPDWVPWHLDGMIGSFVVDVGGVFGALVGDGDTGVKVTWMKQAPNAERAVSLKKSALRFQPSMTETDVATMLEPAVRAAAADGRVRDVPALRKNLRAEGNKFLSVVRLLSHVAPQPGWHIDGFQLSVAIGANGQVTPEISVGGNVNLIFDYQVPQAGPQLADLRRPLSPQDSAAEKNLEAFLSSVSAVIPRAGEGAAAAELRKAGFEFQVFQLGVGFNVAGQIGIASAQATAGGRIVFKRNEANALLASAPLPGPIGIFASSMVPAGAITDDKPAAIDTAKFRRGLNHALRMGAFFAKQAVKVDSPHWKTTEIELALDTNQGGQVGLATIQGSALIRMGFERVEK